MGKQSACTSLTKLMCNRLRPCHLKSAKRVQGESWLAQQRGIVDAATRQCLSMPRKIVIFMLC